MAAKRPFRLALANDLFDGDRPIYDEKVFAALLDSPAIKVDHLPPGTRELTPDLCAAYDSIMLRITRVPAEAVARDDCRLTLISRFGVGYEHIAIDACSAAKLLVTITPRGVGLPVASAIMAFVLSLAHRLPAKDSLARQGRWQEGRTLMGMGLEGRTLGSVGFGNIAQEMFRLARPFGMKHIAHSRNPDQAELQTHKVEKVDFARLLAESDFLTLNCPLTEQTRDLIGAAELAAMKPTAFLINTARGAVVDEGALYRALRNGDIAGAAIDVHRQEPAPADNPLFGLDNVIVTPHSACFTDEHIRLSSQDAVDSILAVAAGRAPDNAVNSELLNDPSFQAKLRGFAG
jgi:D-3-phosphoglycerate dehydrogenase